MEHHEDKLRQCKCSMVCKMNCKRAVVQWVPQNFRFSSPISKIKWEKKKQERSQCLCAEENHETIWGVDAQSKF